MAREDTFNVKATEDFEGSFLNRRGMSSEKKEEQPKEVKEEVVEQQTEATYTNTRTSPLLRTKPSETINKTYVIYKEVAEGIDSLIYNPKTGRRYPGTKGVVSKVVNNALIKELIKIGVLDESASSMIEPY